MSAPNEKLRDVLKAYIHTPSAGIQAVVDALEAAAPKPQEREEQPAGSYVKLWTLLSVSW